MASGERVVTIHSYAPSVTAGASPAELIGGSTQAERIPVYAFDASTVEYLDLLCTLSGYDGGGLTFSLKWGAASATSGNVIWSAAVRRFQDDAEDLDTAHTYDYNNASADAAPSGLNEQSYITVAFTDGADMDSWADGEMAIVRIRRFASDAGDTMAGDAYLWLTVTGVET